jgi:hypothetical protein
MRRGGGTASACRDLGWYINRSVVASGVTVTTGLRAAVRAGWPLSTGAIFSQPSIFAFL